MLFYISLCSFYKRKESNLELVKEIGTLKNFAVLPVNVTSTMAGYDGEAALRDAGVVFHASLADQPHLRLAELPEGWKITEPARKHLLGQRCNLLDDKNRVRARLWQYYYYPAPISQRLVRAEMKVACPFIISFRGERDNNLVVRVRIRHGSEVMAMPPARIKAIKNRGKLGKFKVEKVESMKQWMNEALPNWKSAAKYWDHQKAA